MIESLEIENFRGVNGGRVGPFAPLTILCGLNNCAKSTVLEAAHLVAAGVPALRGLLHSRGGFRWSTTVDGLFWERDGSIAITANGATMSHGVRISARAVAPTNAPSRGINEMAQTEVFQPPCVALDLQLIEDHHVASRASVTVDRVGRTSTDAADEAWGRDQSQFIRPEGGLRAWDLEKFYSAATTSNARIQEILQLMRTVDKELVDLRLVPGLGRPRLRLIYENTHVLADSIGDGERRLLAIAAMSAAANRLVLVDEPERGLNPRALRSVCNLLADVAASGRQVIVSTHSPVLIEALEGALSAREGVEHRVLWLERTHEGSLSSRDATEDINLHLSLAEQTPR